VIDRIGEAKKGRGEKVYVFTYRGKPVAKLRRNAWRRAWGVAGLPSEAGVLTGVHNLRHTLGRPRSGRTA
jgi:hypothetical protein